jgi:hypothetical protein
VLGHLVLVAVVEVPTRLRHLTTTALGEYMILPEIPDDDLERLHWYLGPGKGSEYAYKHVPSGIMVGGTKPTDMKIHEFDQLLIAGLRAKLKAAGLITGTQASEQGA